MHTGYDENPADNPNTPHTVSHSLAESLFERELTDKYQSALNLYYRNLNAGKLTTGSSLLDSLIGGGVETSSLTLLYGD